MWNLSKPILYGVVSAILAMLSLWALTSVLFTIKLGLWYPFLVMVPSLVIGGYISSSQIRSRFLKNYIIIGGIVGFIVLLIAAFLTNASGEIYFWLIILTISSALSSLGAYLGALKWKIRI